MASFLEKIYFALPAFGQNQLISLYGRNLWRKRYGGNLNNLLTEIDRVNSLSLSQQAELKLKNLKALLQYAGDEIPYYSTLFAKINFSPDSFSDLKELQKLPPLDKEILRTRCKEFLPKDFKKKKYYNQKTSGSTGTPLTVYVDQNTYQLAMALLVHHEEQYGVNIGDPRASFAGRMLQKVEDMKPPFWRYNSAENQMLFSAYHLNAKSVELYWKELNRFEPKEIIGYPSAIYTFVVLAQEICGPLHFVPEIVVTNSETLYEWQRKSIESFFNCLIFDYYGTSEYVVFAGQCKSMKYHVNPLLGIAEVVNENYEQVMDEPGELLCTTLSNFSMPLIRYRIGDLATMSSRLCECGCSTQILDKIEGRTDDVLLTKDGRRIGRIDHIFKGVSGIKECQVVQNCIDTFILRVVKGVDFTNNDIETVISNLKSRLGGEIKIEVKLCEFIERTSRGKFRAVVNRMDANSDTVREIIS